jgi:ABC-type transporter Mla subunit MlaD
MRRIAAILAVLAAGAAGLATTAGADDAHTYEIEMYNAFGIVEGSNVRIAGVNAGAVTDLAINDKKRALVTIELSGDLGTLGEDTECSSEPQSLIAEYFISCEPAGPPLEEDDDADDPDADIPASQVAQTVQTDLVQNTLREPYRRRLQLLINEFGTALAGNPETLNEAIRLGAPALTELREVTKILASQNRIIRDLNADSDVVIGKLAERREDVVRFVQEARDTAAISVSRRDDLSRNFEILDDFLAELDPTLVELETLADEQTPLLTDLRGAAPGLYRLATNLPAFNDATSVSLSSLGDASLVGRKALRRGRDEIRLLAEAGRKMPVTAEALADFVRDIDDPRRAVEIDDRAAEDTGRTNPQPATKTTKGYTGFEALLNYLYYFVGTSAQFDRVAHSMHINFQSFETGPCGHVSTGRDPETGEVGVPTNDGGLTTDILEAADCVQWLGPNQPGITEDSGLPAYDPAVCPNGTEPEAAEALCDPGGRARTRAGDATARGEGDRSGGSGGGSAGGSGGGSGDGGSGGDAPGGQGPVPDDVLDDLLDLPGDALDDLPGGLGNGLGNNNNGNGGSGGGLGDSAEAAEDLLDFLLKN